MVLNLNSLYCCKFKSVFIVLAGIVVKIESLMQKLQKLQKMYFSVPKFSVYSGLNTAFFFFFPSQKNLQDSVLPWWPLNV